MGDAPGLTTRREILKRGAIVGGGVLWVTPVVQTLGMGTAFAQPVSSGDDRCSMKPELRDCRRSSQAPWYSTEFWAYIAPGCKCDNLTWDYDIYIARNGKAMTSMNPPGASNPGWYWKWVGIQDGDVITVRCANGGWVGATILDEGDPFIFDASAGNCLVW